MPALTVRTLLMPAATMVILSVVLGLLLFGTHAMPAIALVVAIIVGGTALLATFGRGRTKAPPGAERHDR